MARDKRVREAERKVLDRAVEVSENLQEFWEYLGESHELIGILERLTESIDELEWTMEKVKDETSKTA